MEPKAATLFRALNDLEDRLSLERFAVMGFDIWPRLRSHFVSAEYQILKGSQSTRQSYGHRLARKARSFFTGCFGHVLALARPSGLRRWSPSSSVDVLMLTDAANKRFQVDQRWYDAFVDPIADYYESTGRTVATLETSQRFLSRRPAFRPTRSIMGVMVSRYLWSLTFAWQVRFSLGFLEEYGRYVAALREFGFDDRVVPLRDIRLEVSYLFQLRRYFDSVVRRLRPKAVFLVPYNGYSGIALCAAGRAAGIPVVDIQHGSQGRYHPAYSAFRHLPARGFNLLPNIFLTWSQAEVEAIAEWAEPGGHARALAVGNSALLMFLQNSELSRHHDARFWDAYGAYRGRTLVLITLQWGAYLPEVFRTLLRESPPEFVYLVRLHPNTDRDEVRAVERELDRVASGNVEFRHASMLPIHTLLRHVGFHITQSSSTVLEAQHFSVLSIVTGEIGRAYYEQYFQDGRAVFCDRPTVIIETMRRRVASRTAAFASRPAPDYARPLHQALESVLAWCHDDGHDAAGVDMQRRVEP